MEAILTVLFFFICLFFSSFRKNRSGVGSDDEKANEHPLCRESV